MSHSTMSNWISTRNTLLAVTMVSAVAAFAVVRAVPQAASRPPVQPASEMSPRNTVPAVVAAPDGCPSVRVIYLGYGEGCGTQS